MQKIDTLRNQDKVLKESINLFIGGSIDFLDKDLSGEVTEILSTEKTETITRKAYADSALKLSSNLGVHTEWEADINKDDLIRFGEYNLWLSRMHKIPFITIIVTAKKPSVTKYENPSMTFTPKVINLKERDADKVLKAIKEKLDVGEHNSINALELIYLPLHGSESGKSTAELLDIALKLTPEVAKDDKQKRNKLQDLLFLLTSTFISREERTKLLEANMRILEDNPAIKTLADWGRNQEKVEIAKNMLLNGYDITEISRMTGLEIAKVSEIQIELQAVAN